MNNKENGNNKNFLIVYGIIIVILVVFIMFIIPDDVFLLPYKGKEDLLEGLETEVEEVEFTPISEQIDKIINDNYEYEYNLLDSWGDTTYQYKCEGKINNGLETGTCTEPNKFSYTEKTKKENFKILIKFLDINELYPLMQEVEPIITNYYKIRECDYKVTLRGLETDIIVHTDLENITRIDISNAAMTYIIKYSNFESNED